MEFKRWQGFCLCPTENALCPPDAVPVDAPFAPLVFPVWRNPEKSRGWFAIGRLSELLRPEDCSALLPPEEAQSRTPEPDEFVRLHGATVLNTAFSNAYDFLRHEKPKTGLRLNLAGLGDVGGTLLTALKLLGTEIAEIGIYDPNEALCRRYEMELNQVLSPDGTALPHVWICPFEDLFDCDVFLFTASRGVPPVGSGVSDVRMAQLAKNREMLLPYARKARETGFSGLFCQISDPVDLLCRAVFLESNRDESGAFDGGGLLPEQIRGFGLGVMAARARYWVQKEGIDFSSGRVYGPHGAGLIVANHPEEYDPVLSSRLTELTVSANLRVRELGFKPYIAPALSSGAVSILRLLRGQEHFSAVPMGGAYFGCLGRMSAQGSLLRQEPLHPALFAKIQQTHRVLEGFAYD